MSEGFLLSILAELEAGVVTGGYRLKDVDIRIGVAWRMAYGVSQDHAGGL